MVRRARSLLLAWMVVLLVVATDRGPVLRGQVDGGRSWTIGNTALEREVRFVAGHGLQTVRLTHAATSTDFVSAAREHAELGPEFAVDVDGTALTGTSAAFELVDAAFEDVPRDGRILHVHLRHRASAIDVTASYATYGTHPVTRSWIAITNRSTHVVTLSRLSVAWLLGGVGPPADQQLSAFYGIAPRETAYTGRVDDAAVVLRNSRTHASVAVLNEAPGYLKRTEIGGWDRPFAVGIRAMYDTDLFPFERRLAPGETFTSAPVSLVFFDEGKDGDGGRRVVPYYVTDVLTRRGLPSVPAFIYNTKEPFERAIDKATVAQLVEPASRMGVDVFTIDEGWSAAYGDNAVDPVRFPGGLDDIRKALEAKGIRLGLSLPLAAIDTATDTYRQHPEWASRDADGRLRTTGTVGGTNVVMCLASPYRHDAAARIKDAIRRFHLAYVKLDLAAMFNAYGEGPGCHAAGHDHASWAESLGRTYEGIAAVTREVSAEFPDVTIDLTFEAWGQKHLVDYALLAAADVDWLSNVDDATMGSAGPQQARTLLYQRAFAMPAEALLVGSLQAEREPADERLATMLGSGPLLLGDLRKVPLARQTWYGQHMEWFKALRHDVRLQEQFLPLGSWRQPQPTEWDGYARLSRAGEGIVVVFRNDAAVADASVRLPFTETARFQVRSVLTGLALGVVAGAEFRHGYRVPLPRPGAVEILELRKAGPILPPVPPRP